MSLFRAASKSKQRSSLKINIKMVNRKGEPLDESEAWQALIDCFKKHPTLDVFQAEISPDKDADEL